MGRRQKPNKQPKQRTPTGGPSHYRRKPLPEGYLGSVTIAGDEIEIWRAHNLASPDSDKLDGCYLPSHDRIFLDTLLSPKAEKQTLVHELWHAIRHKYEIPVSDDLEEGLAGPIGNGFASALSRWLPKGALKAWGGTDD